MMLDKKMIITTGALFALAVLVSLLIRDHSTQIHVGDASERFADIDTGSYTNNAGFGPLQNSQGLSVAAVNGSNPDAASDGIGFMGADTNPIYADYSGKSSTDEGCYPRDRNVASDLLPEGAASKWAQQNPSGEGAVGDNSFLTAGYHVGVITSNMRNSNMGLRSEPANPINKGVSIWNQSNIEPDLMRRKLEVE